MSPTDLITVFTALMSVATQPGFFIALFAVVVFAWLYKGQLRASLKGEHAEFHFAYGQGNRFLEPQAKVVEMIPAP